MASSLFYDNRQIKVGHQRTEKDLLACFYLQPNGISHMVRIWSTYSARSRGALVAELLVCECGLGRQKNLILCRVHPIIVIFCTFLFWQITPSLVLVRLEEWKKKQTPQVEILWWPLADDELIFYTHHPLSCLTFLQHMKLGRGKKGSNLQLIAMLVLKQGAVDHEHEYVSAWSTRVLTSTYYFWLVAPCRHRADYECLFFSFVKTSFWFSVSPLCTVQSGFIFFSLAANTQDDDCRWKLRFAKMAETRIGKRRRLWVKVFIGWRVWNSTLYFLNEKKGKAFYYRPRKDEVWSRLWQELQQQPEKRRDEVHRVQSQPKTLQHYQRKKEWNWLLPSLKFYSFFFWLRVVPNSVWKCKCKVNQLGVHHQFSLASISVSLFCFTAIFHSVCLSNHKEGVIELAAAF